MAWINCLGIEPTILRGDAGILGWGITLIYAVTFVTLCLCWQQAGRGQRGFWLCLSLIIGILALNKQLDLQVFLNAYGRCIAQAQGWFDSRRTVQAVFVVVFLSSILALLSRGVWVIWPERHKMMGILGGILALSIFVAGRAMSIQHVDTVLGVSFDLSRIKNLLELVGICLIMGNSLILLRKGFGKFDKAG